jgi:bifunctional DNase/RNase
MSLVKLNILGLSSGQSSGSYTLILGEENGKRKLPIVIGSFEAQAIAIEIEKIIPFRPMTHDLFVNFAQTFSIDITEVQIYDLVEGVFHAKLVCEREGEIYEIDARTSDSIALAVRFKCPIYTTEGIMQDAGVTLEEDDIFDQQEEQIPAKPRNEFSEMTIDELEAKLEEAIREEDYTRAARLRDEINKRI